MKKKGFTLIELLAVIIILAILMIIAIPNILNTLRIARQKSFITQAQSIYKTAEQQFIISSMNNNTVACFDDSGSSNLDLSSKSPNLKYYVKLARSTGKVEEIEVQDTAQGFKIVLTPSQGNDYVLQNEIDGSVITTGATGERSIGSCSGGGSSNNNNNSGNNSGNNTPDPEPIVTFNGTCVGAPSGNEEHSGLPATYKGICYLDPKNLAAECDSTSALSDGNTGCKKFYIYDDSGSTYKMLMWKNTASGPVQWNYSCDPDCLAPGEVAEAFDSDTAGWSGSPRLITAMEVANIVGASNWKADGFNADVDIIMNLYFGTERPWVSYESGMNEEERAIQRSYHWLFDYTYGCTEFGCELADDNDYDSGYAYGYWTSTSFSYGDDYSAVWNVGSSGALLYSQDDMWNYVNGIRPVITLNKSLFA